MDKIRTFDQFKLLLEFNRKDRDIIDSIGGDFTISFEFELETTDPKLSVPETVDSLLTYVSETTMEQLDRNNIKYR